MMRHFFCLVITSFFTVQLIATSLCFAIPVYLRIDSQFPSGHHSHQLLENRTKKIQFQRWFQVETKDKFTGWIPEDYCLTALKLAEEATLKDQVPVRKEPLMDVFGQELINKGTPVRILSVDASWAQVRFYRGNSNVILDSWIPSESLEPVISSSVSPSNLENVYLIHDGAIHILPDSKARKNGKVVAGSIVQVKKINPAWFEIISQDSSGRGSKLKNGFLQRSDVITISDLTTTGAYPIQNLVPLRSAPLPYADLLRNLVFSTRLKIKGVETLRWGLARVPDVGEIWWPIIENHRDEEKGTATPEKISSNELFLRKIFDMASSPAIPSLKFASAKGVYRTVDGKQWTKLATFQDKDFPIAIAGLGSVFVGPYLSDDQGETFQQWIRWDTLISVLRRQSQVTPQSLKIHEIRPEDPTGRRVVLKLAIGNGNGAGGGIGNGSLVKLVTEDQGHSWRTLNR